jgi:archaellum component FlaC
MSDSAYRFRSALGGYHKGDVAGYIEKTAAQHRSELLEREATITSLREENHSLQQQLNLLMMSTPAPAPAPEPAPAPVPEPAPAPAPAPAEMSATELLSSELQAYRRAEAVERNASQRARKLYRQLETVCEDALGEFQNTDSAVKQTIEQMLEQANALEQAYQALSAALNNSREKLATMNDLLCIDEEE